MCLDFPNNTLKSAPHLLLLLLFVFKGFLSLVPNISSKLRNGVNSSLLLGSLL